MHCLMNTKWIHSYILNSIFEFSCQYIFIQGPTSHRSTITLKPSQFYARKSRKSLISNGPSISLTRNSHATIYTPKGYESSVANDLSNSNKQTRAPSYNSEQVNSLPSSGPPIALNRVTKTPAYSSKATVSTYANDHSTPFSNGPSDSYDMKISRSNESPNMPNETSLRSSKSFNPQLGTELTRGPSYTSKSHKPSRSSESPILPAGTTKSPSSNSKSLKRIPANYHATSLSRPTLQTSHSSEFYKPRPPSRSLFASSKLIEGSVYRSKSFEPSSVSKFSKGNPRSKATKPISPISLVSRSS